MSEMTVRKIVHLESSSIGRDISLDCFREFGEFICYPEADFAKTEERIGDAEIVLINKTPMNAVSLRHADRLKLICEMATGYDNVDIDYCRSRGIAVVNAGHYSTTAVAQHTFGLALYLLEKLHYYDTFVKSGAYGRQGNFTFFDRPIIELDGCVWGIAGMGEIGRRTADIAAAFGCRVISWSPSGKPAGTEERTPGGTSFTRVDFDTFLRTSDVVSVHCPLSGRTRHLFNDEAFGKMKPTAVLINVARGPIVDEKALYRALTGDLIAGAGLDVLEREPMRENNPLKEITDSGKLIITPHNAWASVRAREKDVKITYDNIRSYLSGGTLNRVDL